MLLALRADRRRLRTVLGAGLLIAALVVGGVSIAGAGVASKLPKGPKIDRTKPCTLLSTAQVAKVFATTATVDPTNADSVIATDCAWVVGDPAAPAGRLVALVLYPAFGGSPSIDAVDIVESDRASAQISGSSVVDLPLGKGGFIERPRSFAEVAPTKMFAFSLEWQPTGGPPEGTLITPAVKAALSKLAADVSRRGKRAHLA
jgi:hypothetical protein